MIGRFTTYRRLFPLCLGLVAAGRAAPADLETEVRRTDEERMRALVTGDVALLRSIIHPECVYTHGSGRVQSGEDYLALLSRGELRYLAMRYEFPPEVRLIESGSAIVQGRVQLTGQGLTGAANVRLMTATAVYAKQGPQWRLMSYQSTPAPAAPAVSILSQRLAVENVCAWPKLTLLKDGTLIAALYNQPSHGLLPGDVACWASNDGGVTWQRRGNATNHEGNSAWFNHALGVAGNGDLLVATSGWNYAAASGAKTDTPLVPVVTRSADGGKTWKQIGRFPEAPESGKSLIPFGNIERGDEGVLRVAAYAFGRGLPPPRSDTGYIVSSVDNGATWSITATIGKPEVNETDLLHVGGNRWLAAARNLGTLNGRGAHGMDIYVSDDDARTWRKHGRLTSPNEHPGDLLKLADGRILLVYGDRRGPDFGVNAMLSTDGGLNWSPEFRFAGGFLSRDSGYPSSVQLRDGTIVTAYYANGAREFPGYHMGVVRWRLE
ncbi:MAG: DUF4440 domain-containing protein [Opitutus sp.]|nr:DUF4440 domain-containing protein [Opitutus sp.]